MELRRGEEFSIGSVVVPAANGMLESLGHDVKALGERGLGVVTETRPKKSLVQFPELKLSLWLEHDELADVEARARAGQAEYLRLLPKLDALPPTLPAAWWVWILSRSLPVTHILGMEKGPLAELWAEGPETLARYHGGDPELEVTYVGLGIQELFLQDWSRLERLIGPRLLFARFLPAGMHKIELALYLKESA